MSNCHASSPSFIVSLALAAGALACGGSGNGEEPGSGGGGGTEPGGGGSSQQGACSENALFAPVPYGDGGTDMVRRIEVDADTGDVWFSTWQEIYRLPSGSDTPVQVMARPESAVPLDGAFWLRDAELLMPAAGSIGQLITAATPGATTDIIPVLYAAPRTGDAPTLQVSAPAPPEDLVFYEIHGARVVGDEVFWVDARVVREDFSTAAPLTRTYRARRASWRSPAAEPIELYTSQRSLEVPIVAGDIAFIDERNNERADGGSVQRMVHLDGGSVDPTSAEERFGGKVVAADASSLLISSTDISDPENYGVFRVALDGSQRERVMRFTSFNEPRSQDGVWAYTEYDFEVGHEEVYVYEVGAPPRRVGCVGDNASSIHDVVVSNGEVLVAVFYDDFTTNILRYPF